MDRVIVCLVGCAGAGKSSIIAELVRRWPQEYATFATYTTRQKRENETGNYVFVSHEEFAEKQPTMYEWNEVHGEWYGGSEELWPQDSRILVKDIDCEGARLYRERYGAISIFVDADDALLERRMVERGDSRQSIERRLTRNRMERECVKECDFVVVNEGNLDEAVEKVRAAIAERK